MHIEGEFVACSDEDIFEYYGSLSESGNFYNIAIFYFKVFRVGDTHMDVSLGDDESLGEVEGSMGSDDVDSFASLDISTFTNRGFCSEFVVVGEEDFHLGEFSVRSKEAHSGDFSFRSFDGEGFFTGELSGLREVFEMFALVI